MSLSLCAMVNYITLVIQIEKKKSHVAYVIFNYFLKDHVYIPRIQITFLGFKISSLQINSQKTFSSHSLLSAQEQRWDSKLLIAKGLQGQKKPPELMLHLPKQRKIIIWKNSIIDLQAKWVLQQRRWQKYYLSDMWIEGYHSAYLAAPRLPPLLLFSHSIGNEERPKNSQISQRFILTDLTMKLCFINKVCFH